MIAAYCGSFDPVTNGHMDIINRASRLFDEVIVFVSGNISKKAMLSLEIRKQLLEACCKDLPNVRVEMQDGISVFACRQAGAGVMIRGVRSGYEMDYEANMNYMNRMLDPDMETVIMMARPEYIFCSSTNVRELLAFGQDVSKLVPKPVCDYLEEWEALS